MKLANTFLDYVKNLVKRLIRTGIARPLNKLTAGKLTPATVTLTGLVMHLAIAWLIAESYFGYAALALIVFGLFDALDGELARLQGKAGPAGMLLDSVTDRLKEVMLYTGAAVAMVHSGEPDMAAWAVAACGASICVSYVNAWGEVVMSQTGNHNKTEVNQAFRSGLARFEVRMAILVVGLFTSRLIPAVVLIALLSAFTVIERLVRVSRSL